MVAPVSHAKKHDINSDNDHIKNDLDLNGNFSLISGNRILFNRGGSTPYTLYWDNPNTRFHFDHTLEVAGSLLLEGEATIKGGSLTNDSLTLYPSRVANTPAFTFEGESYAGFMVDPNKNEDIWIKDTAYSSTTFFSFKHSATGNHSFTIGHDAGDTDIYMNGYIDTIITHRMYAGDNSSDYLFVDSDGTITLYGDARQIRELVHDAYNLYGNSATYNGVSCSAAGAGVINDYFYSMTLNGGSGWGGGPEAFITTFKMPADYDEGTDVDIVIHYTSDTTSGSAFVGVGVKPASTSYNKNESFQTKTIPAPSTVYDRTAYSYTFTGTSFSRGDELGVVVYRDPDNANDDMNGDAMITSIAMEYIADQIGGSV